MQIKNKRKNFIMIEKKKYRKELLGKYCENT